MIISSNNKLSFGSKNTTEIQMNPVYKVRSAYI